MQRARAFEELGVRLAVQSQVADVLAAAPSLEDATPKFLEIVCDGLGWDWGELWEVDRSADVLRCVEVWHRPGIDVAQFEAMTRRSVRVRGQGLPGQIWASKRADWIADGAGIPRYPRTDAAIQAGFHAGVAFPICLGGEVLGVMELITRDRRPRDEDTI